ncbi:hypothetical protein ABVT39_004061 [Epinephelus coioides]
MPGWENLSSVLSLKFEHRSSLQPSCTGGFRERTVKQDREIKACERCRFAPWRYTTMSAGFNVP